MVDSENTYFETECEMTLLGSPDVIDFVTNQ